MSDTFEQWWDDNGCYLDAEQVGILGIAKATWNAARAEEHARCVRLMEDRYGEGNGATYWLKRNPPKGEV